MAMTTETGARVKHETLVEALAAAQGEFPAVVKDRKATVKSDKGSYSYSYANLADVLAAVRPVLSGHGIAILQHLAPNGGGIMLHTELRGYGEVLGSSMPVTSGPAAPQALGSALSYYRRYALMALVGVAAEEDDDDGHAATSSPPERRPTPQQGRSAAPAEYSKSYDKPEPLPPRAAAPDDPYDVGEHTFSFGKERLTGPEWLDAISRKARDPDTDPGALRTWWESPKQVAERARFHKLKHELNPMLDAVKQEVSARFPKTPTRPNGQTVGPVDALRGG